MFCTNCGKEIGEDGICPSCSHAEANAATETNAATEANAAIKTNAADETNYSFGIVDVPKKRKWPKVLGIAALVIAIISAVLYFTYPLYSPMLNPEKYAKEVLKKHASAVEEKIIKAIETYNSELSVDYDQTGSIKFEKLIVDDQDLLAGFSERELAFTGQNSAENAISGGTLSFGSDTSNPVKVEFYMSDSVIQFKIPALSSKIFKMDVSELSYASSMGGYGNPLAGLDSQQIQTFITQNSAVIVAVVKDVFAGVDVLIDNSSYDRIGNVKLDTPNGKFRTNAYEINITEDAVKKFAEAVVENVYSDTQLTSYTSLLTMYAGTSKQSLISMIERANLGFNKIPLEVNINNKKEVIRWYSDLSEIAESTCKMEFILAGDKKITDYTVSKISLEDTNIDLVTKTKENGDFSIVANMDAQNQFQSSPEKLNLETEGNYKIDEKNNDIIINKLVLTGDFGGSSVDIAFSGDLKSKKTDNITVKSLGSSNIIDYKNMTVSQKKEVYKEISGNIPSLKGRLSQMWIDKIKSYVDTELAGLK